SEKLGRLFGPQMEGQAVPGHGSLRMDGIFTQAYGRAEGSEILRKTDQTGCQISQRPFSPTATPGSRRIPDGFQCESHSRSQEGWRAHRTDSDFARSSTTELAIARRQRSPPSCRYALSGLLVVERRPKPAGKQRASSGPNRRPDGRPGTAPGTEILYADPSGNRSELQKTVGFI